MRTAFAISTILVLAVVAPTGGRAREADRDLLALADEARDAATKLRRLAVREPIRTRVASREEIERYVVGRVSDPVVRKSFALAGASLAALGLIDTSYDVEGLVLRMAREQVAGFWDFERKTLFLADWIPRFLQKPTLVHEFTHALQDQHFAIGRFMKPLDRLSEPSGAVAAMLEGDATVVMMESVTGVAMGGEEGDRVARMMDRFSGLLSIASGLGDVPAVLRDSLLFPYIGGMRFVLGVRGDGGWDRVDALYKDPPISTEQVLHPEKVAPGTRDDPIEVRLPAIPPPGRGYAALGSDVMGEFGIRAALEQTLDHDQAAKAAAGWGGDRYVAWRKGKSGPVVMLWVTVWDTEADAVEAEAALAKMKVPPARLERRGDAVAGVWGNAGGREAATIDTAMRGLKRTKVHDVESWVKAAGR
jgi:hypothetical protein